MGQWVWIELVFGNVRERKTVAVVRVLAVQHMIWPSCVCGLSLEMEVRPRAKTGQVGDWASVGSQSHLDHPRLLLWFWVLPAGRFELASDKAAEGGRP